MTNHAWGSWEAVGHGSGDGTPAGVYTSRTCRLCRCVEYRDSAISTHTGGSRPARGYRDSRGKAQDERPDCLGYDPLPD